MFFLFVLSYIFFHSSSNSNLLFSFLLFLFRFEIETEQEIFDEVLHGDLDFSSDPWPNISESAIDLVRKMLVRDPRKRITAHEVLCKFFLFSVSSPMDIYDNNCDSDVMVGKNVMSLASAGCLFEEDALKFSRK